MDRNTTPDRFLPRLGAMAAAALVVAGGILASDAQAQVGFCKQEAYYTSKGYVYRRCGVPDFDQKRLNALPDDGAVHCAVLARRRRSRSRTLLACASSRS